MTNTAVASAELDDIQTSLEHRDIIRRKRFLREIYRDHYRFFLSHRAKVPSGAVIELGSGGGFIQEFIPDAITSDVVPLPECQLVCSAEKLPFGCSQLSGIFMINVFHHIQDVTCFLREAVRCLKPGGCIAMVEPAHTPWSRFIYRNFHHEPFEPQQVEWQLPPGGRLSSANDALPWIVFVRDRQRFEELYPELSIQLCEPFMPFRYLLSGGVSKPQLLPSWTYPAVNLCEKVLSPFNPQLALFMRIAVVRK